MESEQKHKQKMFISLSVFKQIVVNNIKLNIITYKSPTEVAPWRGRAAEWKLWNFSTPLPNFIHSLLHLMDQS